MRAVCAACRVYVLASLLYLVDSAGGWVGNAQSVKGSCHELWPIHFSSIPLAGNRKKGGDPFYEPDFGNDLVRIGLEKFKEYISTTLPKELEVDKSFAEEFAAADGSRVQAAFWRWQKQVFADRMKMKDSQFGGMIGGGNPKNERLPGVNYEWKELYESQEYARLLRAITYLSKKYIRESGWPDRLVPKSFRIFISFEIFSFADYIRPWARTDGAYLSGKYFAKYEQGSQKLAFEDPRGINPPYGKTFHFPPYTGNLVMFPNWVSSFFTPNIKNMTNVVMSFAVYPLDGNDIMDWDAQETAHLVVNREVTVKRQM
eukprot:gnl/TRDRNA2_/TRDRNA2_195429_c0_seq1.p1 gnl/TRDRNA2_/TRDRNA2_195429_c0~~gnl/TRDRNA2_/TRDRNA2_195429_c0_seq1.p1  ORF type:complete len:315 (-),score=38.67 gnl/TRDRNA2_/TRDRNA2_195429_c0_seq1:92-1036(-)